MRRDRVDTSICIRVVKSHPPKLNERVNRLADRLCISTIAPAELHDGAEKSARRLDNLEAIRQFASRLAILPFSNRRLDVCCNSILTPTGGDVATPGIAALRAYGPPVE